MTTFRDITLQCPVCGTWFVSRSVAEIGPPAGTHTDFHRRADGPRALACLVHMCSGCGFAGVQDDFAGDEVSAASATEMAGDRVPVTTCESVLGSEKYEAAAAIAERRGAGPLAVGDLLLRAAWCCVDEADVEGERFFRWKAAASFEGALSRYDEVSRDRRAEYTYLVGELWRRAGERARAREWFDRVAGEVADPATEGWILRLAMQQRDQPREWLG